MVLLLLFVLPAGMALLIRIMPAHTPDRMLEFVLSWILIPLALLPLVALLYASGIIQDEQEEQTITYLLVRPIPTWLMYIVKLLATLTTAILLVVFLTLLTYAAIYFNSGTSASEAVRRCVRAAEIHSLAVIVYCSVFGLMSLVTRRTLIIGVMYTAIVEGLLAILPFGIRMVTVVYYTRIIAYRSMDFVVTWPRGREVNVAAGMWSFDIKNDPGLAEHPALTTAVSALLSACVIFTIIAAYFCSQREFHVKTPEKE
jgi:ABC-2 type transport system permease protein